MKKRLESVSKIENEDKEFARTLVELPPELKFFVRGIIFGFSASRENITSHNQNRECE